MNLCMCSYSSASQLRLLVLHRCDMLITCMYVCSCIFAYMCMYVCMYVCVNIHWHCCSDYWLRTGVRGSWRICAYICACMYACMYVCMYVCL